MLMVSPKAASARMPARNEPGIATPTMAAERGPSAATITIMTSRMALATLFCRSASMVRMLLDLSWL